MSPSSSLSSSLSVAELAGIIAEDHWSFVPLVKQHGHEWAAIAAHHFGSQQQQVPSSADTSSESEPPSLVFWATLRHIYSLLICPSPRISEAAQLIERVRLWVEGLAASDHAPTDSCSSHLTDRALWRCELAMAAVEMQFARHDRLHMLREVGVVTAHLPDIIDYNYRSILDARARLVVSFCNDDAEPETIQQNKSLIEQVCANVAALTTPDPALGTCTTQHNTTHELATC